MKVRTRYVTRPNSNVGGIRVTWHTEAGDRQLTIVNPEANNRHRDALMQVFGNVTFTEIPNRWDALHCDWEVTPETPENGL